MTPYLAAFCAALFTSLALVITQRWHGRFSMDSSFGVQKFHTQPTPRVGGMAIIFGLLAATAASSPDVKDILLPMLVAGIPAFGAGFLEDVTKKVGVLARLLATMCSGALAWYLTGVAMRDTGIAGLDWVLTFTPVAVLFTAFAVGGVANAVNITDGFNGLAAGSVAIMLSAMGLIAFSVGDASLATACLLLTAVALGFGAVNWPFGKIFLGDGGAYLLGFLLAWVAVLLPMRSPHVNAWATLLVCAYPVLEVGFSFRRKLGRKGHHPGQPDKVHFHMLVYRRVARPLLRNAGRPLQNGMTSPFIWMYSALPAAWAVVNARDTVMLAIGFSVAIVVYALLYVRLTQFRWPLGLLVRAKLPSSALSRRSKRATSNTI